MSENYYVCPKCHHTSIFVFLENESEEKNEVVCNDCGWEGRMSELEIRNGTSKAGNNTGICTDTMESNKRV